MIKTPIQGTIPTHFPRVERPCLRLDSKLDDTGRSVDHRMSIIRSPATYTDDSLLGRIVREAEDMVVVPRRMIWMPRTVYLTMAGTGYGEPNGAVLQAFSDIKGVRHNINLQDIRYHEAEDAYTLDVERGRISAEIEDYREATRYWISKAALAAAGLRLAAATTIMDATRLEDQPRQDEM